MNNYPQDIAEEGRVLRIAEFLNSNEWKDLFWPISVWPAWVRAITFKQHKRNRERYALFFFLVVNGLHPQSASQIVLMSDVQGNIIMMNDLRPKVTRHLEQMERQVAERTFFSSGKRYYDLALGRVTTTP